jgi:hypothetical protein
MTAALHGDTKGECVLACDVRKNPPRSTTVPMR